MTQLPTALIRQVRRDLMTRSFKHFVKEAWHTVEPDTPLIWGWHIDALCDHLQAVSEGKITRLCISISPGSMKSLLAAVFWPAWEWTFKPGTRFVVASHSMGFASRDSIRCRDVIQSEWYQSYWPVEMKEDANQTLKFINKNTGYRWALPYSKLTGGRGNRLLIDDPISVMDALTSEVEREKVNQTFLSSATSRLNNAEKDAIVIIAQRIHMDDLIGRIQEIGLDYVHLVIPMEYEGDTSETAIGWSDPRTEIGELMLPEQRSQKSLDELKKADVFAYSAQYQQNPVPPTDGFFRREWFQRYDLGKKPEHLNYYITSDHAPGGGARNDFNVVRVWGLDHEKNLYLVDWLRDQCDLTTAMGISSKDGKLTVGDKGALYFVKKYKPQVWFAEPDNNFRSIEKLVRQVMTDTNTMCRLEHASLHHLKKDAKAQAYVAMAQNGKIFIPKCAEGDATIVEYLQFPVGKNDDRVDADAILAREITGTHPAIIPPAKPLATNDGYKLKLSRPKDRQSHLF